MTGLLRALKSPAQYPGAAFTWFVGIQIFLWTLVPNLVHSAPPLDVVEMYIWGREWVVATYKHPNLPGYLLETSRVITGGAYWPAYLVSQLCIGATFWAVYTLGKEFMGAPRALAGSVLLIGIYYYSLSSVEFNHNVMQMPLWAGIALATWRSVNTGRLLWWAILGVLAALSMWAKYSSFLILIIAGIWILSTRRGRASLKTPGPYVMAAIGLIVVAPQIHYLLSTDFLPFSYATRRAEGSADPWYDFPLAQTLNHIVMFILIGIAGLFGRNMRVKAGDEAAGNIKARQQNFLLLFALGPAGLAIVMSIVFGWDMKTAWGMPMFSLSGLAFIGWLGGRLTDARLKRLTISAFVLMMALPVLYGVAYSLIEEGKAKRIAWPQQDISQFMQAEYARETQSDLKYVTGDYWTAGLVALGAPGSPSVYIDADIVKSQWIDPADVTKHGTLVVWYASFKYNMPPSMAEFIKGYDVKTKSFMAHDNPKSQSIDLNYVIILPQK